MASHIPVIIVDEHGQPVRLPSAQTVAQDIPIGGSTLRLPASIRMQGGMQREAQACQAVHALHTLATRVTDALPLFHPQALVAFHRQKATPTPGHAAWLTANAQLHKMQAALAAEHARFQQMHQELRAVLPRIELRWKEGQARAQRLAEACQPRIVSHWQEGQEWLQPLRASVQAITERIREVLQPFHQEMLRAQQTHQRLVAPFQAIWLDWQARLPSLIAWMASEAFQEEAQQTSDLITIVGAYCPLSREHDPDQQQEAWFNAAVTRLIAHLPPGLRHPRAAHALRQKAAAQHTSPQQFLRTEVFPTAIQLVASDVTSPRRMRVGREWVTDRHGKVLVASPGQLSIPAFRHWFLAQVYAAAAAIVLDEVYPRPTTPQAPVLLYEADALERLTAPASSGARDSALLTPLLQTEEMDPADQLHRVFSVASPRARALCRLLRQGLSIKEAAAILGISPSTVYVHCYRTRAKVRRRSKNFEPV